MSEETSQQEPRDPVCGARCPHNDGSCGKARNHCTAVGDDHECDNDWNHTWAC